MRMPGRGEVIELNGKLYGTCAACNKFVRIDKPLFGGLHICEPEGQR